MATAPATAAVCRHLLVRPGTTGQVTRRWLMTSRRGRVWLRSTTLEHEPHQSPAGGAALCGRTTTRLSDTAEVTRDQPGEADLHVSHGGRDVLLHPLQILILEHQAADGQAPATPPPRPASPSLTTLLALAEPLVSFFIPLIFIPSAHTNRREASSDSGT